MGEGWFRNIYEGEFEAEQSSFKFFEWGKHTKKDRVKSSESGLHMNPLKL